MDISYLLLRRLPIILMALAGILIAIVRWKRHPKVSLLAVLGMGLFLLESLTFMFVYYFLPRFVERGWTFGSVTTLYALAQACQDFLFAAVIILLVVAAFSQREPPASRVEPKSVAM
jgi:hypothetical protein